MDSEIEWAFSKNKFNEHIIFVLETRWPACNTEKFMEGDLQDRGIEAVFVYITFLSK